MWFAARVEEVELRFRRAVFWFRSFVPVSEIRVELLRVKKNDSYRLGSTRVHEANPTVRYFVDKFSVFLHRQPAVW